MIDWKVVRTRAHMKHGVIEVQQGYEGWYVSVLDQKRGLCHLHPVVFKTVTEAQRASIQIYKGLKP